MNENGHGGCIDVFPPGSPQEIVEYEFALHDWRLASREWTGGGWQETWYCTRCRLVDERRASA